LRAGEHFSLWFLEMCIGGRHTGDFAPLAFEIWHPIEAAIAFPKASKTP
jgi:hypothetical protein